MNVTIPYRPGKMLVIVGFVAFGACACLFGHIAIEGKTALSIFRLVTLYPPQSVPAFWVLASMSGLLSIGALVLFFYSIFNVRNIMFEDDTFLFPKKGWSSKYHRIWYDSVTGTQEVKVSGTKIYYVYFGNSSIALASSMVPKKRLYELFKAELGKRVGK